jgi:hypothetical protein
MLLRKERSLAAGFCWALAMLKPQIGFPFLFLFILTKSWTGLLAGFMILVVMSEAALLWTGLNPWSYLLAGPLTESFSFTKEQSATGAALWMTGINLSAPFAAFAALLAVIILGGVYAVRQNRIQLPLLDAAGVCSAIGFVLFYHRSYDNIMLYPLILAIFHRMLQDRGNYFIIAVCLLLAFTAFLPVGLIGRHQVLLYLSLLTPIVGAGVLLVRGNSNVPMNQRTYLPLK